MKVNAITNTNFKGLFVNKTKENGGNWRMEYHPYSWEKKPKALKEHVDVFASTLPDNEEIYTELPRYKESKDILGTVSYFSDQRNGKDIVRRTIEDMPSMNLEDSLLVKDKKLKAFIKMKQEAMQELKESLENRKTRLFNLSQDHAKYVEDVKRWFLSYRYSKDEQAKGLQNNFDKTLRMAEEFGNNFEEYATISESVDKVRSQREQIQEMLSKIEKAKKEDLFVDISRRDIKNANEPLRVVFNNMEKAKRSLFALSNKVILGSQIVEAIGKDFTIEKAIAYVENLMKKKI